MTAISRIVHHRLDERGWDIKTLAAALAPKNPQGSLCKLREMLSGEHVRRGVLDAVCTTLEIDPAERKAALEEDRLARLKQIEEYQRPRFEPHFWIEVTRDWFPSLLTVTGPDIYRKIPVPPEIIGLEDEEEIIKQAGQFVSGHFDSKNRRVPREQVTHYLYRKAFDIAYRFKPDGTFVEKITAPIIAPITTLRIGG